MKIRLPRLKRLPTGKCAAWVLAIAALQLAGCATKYYVPREGCPPQPVAPPPKVEHVPRSYVVLIPSPDGSVGKVVVKGAKGEQVLDQAGQAGAFDGRPMQVDGDLIKADFGDAMAAQPTLPTRFLLYFKTGTTLTAESLGLIPKIVAETQSRPAVDVSVIGHADTLNSSEYNDRLAMKRATKVADLLHQQGLKENSLAIESHGKRNLLIPTADNVYEPRNRRVEISVR